MLGEGSCFGVCFRVWGVGGVTVLCSVILTACFERYKIHSQIRFIPGKVSEKFCLGLSSFVSSFLGLGLGRGVDCEGGVPFASLGCFSFRRFLGSLGRVVFLRLRLLRDFWLRCFGLLCGHFFLV